MARPSQNIDKKLLEIGKKRLMSQGISGISIRSMCMESGINLGMFHYYFKSKENYIRILFKSMIDDLNAYWVKESAGLTTYKEKLKKVLFLNAKIMKEERGTMETIIRSIDIFDEFYVQLRKEMHKRFNDFHNEIIDGCKEEGYLQREVDNDKYIAIFSGSVIHYGENCIEEEAEQYYDKLWQFIEDLADFFSLK